MLKFLERRLTGHARRRHETWLTRSQVIVPAPHHTVLRGTPEAAGKRWNEYA
jgi:hypothetical protein